MHTADEHGGRSKYASKAIWLDSANWQSAELITVEVVMTAGQYVYWVDLQERTGWEGTIKDESEDMYVIATQSSGVPGYAMIKKTYVYTDYTIATAALMTYLRVEPKG